jgi:hypothetical protein
MSDYYELEGRRIAKFDEIAAVIAHDLGLSSLSELSWAEGRRIAEDANHAIEEWEMVETDLARSGPKYTLQMLLRQYHEICEDMLEL